ncbi:MAG TPA: lysylphosphatidylglycerol synthase transmembrane domain-containing protein, partial [Candidatus Sulfomarinibacteraceae bacterium]|nr:lysylphosphatidylglycerol synthase transmembrane domain-containing protein [Candidatus Sulfomarinibacteraceae bacterium]
PWRQILNGDWRALSIGAAIYGVVGGVSALRLRWLTGTLIDAPLASRRRFYYLNMVARVLGLVLPRGLSALGGKSVGLRALGISLRRSLWIVLMDNVYDVLTLGVATLPAIFFLRQSVTPVSFGALTAVAWLVLGGAIWVALRRRWLSPRLGWLASRLPWLSRRLQLDGASTDNLLPTARESMGALLYTLLLNLLLISTYFTIARALDIQASWWLFAACFPITQLSLIIAVAPGGLGIFDLGWLGLLRLGGLSQNDALTFVVAQRAYIFVFVLVWAAVSALLAMTERKVDTPKVGDPEGHGETPPLSNP